MPPTIIHVRLSVWKGSWQGSTRLLVGVIPKDKFDLLVLAVQDKREALDDPRLSTVQDEIGLRASAELAKLGQLT